MKWRRVAVITLFFVLLLSLSGCQLLPPLVAKTHTPGAVVKDSPTPTVKIPTGYAQSTSEGKEASSQDESTATPEGEESTSTPEAEESTAEPKSTPIASTDGSLSSYRIHAETHTDNSDGALEEAWDVEVVTDPFAYYTKVSGELAMEGILIGATYWMRMDEGEWRKIEFTEEELKDWDPTQLKTSMELDEKTPKDTSITWLMGQPEINLAKGSLTEAGSETIDGVVCKHYTVDSMYIFKVTYTEPINASAEITEMQQGDIWVADQAGMPAFLMRSRLLETSTTVVEEGESSTTVLWKMQDVTDVNSPDIVVVAPE